MESYGGFFSRADSVQDMIFRVYSSRRGKRSRVTAKEIAERRLRGETYDEVCARMRLSYFEPLTYLHPDTSYRSSQRHKKSEANETPEHREERLKKHRERKRAFMLRETPQHRAKRLARERNYEQNKRQEEKRQEAAY